MFEVDNIFALTAILALGVMALIPIFYLIANDLFPIEKLWGLKWVVDKMKKKKAEKFLSDALSEVVKATMIYNANQSLMEEVGGDRADFKLLHNGGKSPSGQSYKYATSKFEVVSSGTARKAHQMQRYPIEGMPYFFKTILTEDVEEMSSWRDVKNIKDPMLKNYCEESGVQSIIGFLVQSKSGDPIIYCIEWINDNAENFCDLDPDAYLKMKHKAQSIASLL